MVAREGQTGVFSPGLGGDERFSFFNSSTLALNNDGQIAFLGTLSTQTEGVWHGNDTGIWATDENGDLRLLVRENGRFDVDPTEGVDRRRIKEISFHPPWAGSTFNDDGMLVAELSFHDGSSGIFTVIVPEPSTIALLTLVLTRSLTRQLRRTATYAAARRRQVQRPLRHPNRPLRQ